MPSMFTIVCKPLARFGALKATPGQMSGQNGSNARETQGNPCQRCPLTRVAPLTVSYDDGEKRKRTANVKTFDL